MSDFEGSSAYAHYSVFDVGDEASKYLLTVSGYSGNAGDSLAFHNNMFFTTYDREHDTREDEIVPSNTMEHGGITIAIIPTSTAYTTQSQIPRLQTESAGFDGKGNTTR
ncbi:hypothetical protein ScPMuIL_010249 [Solemya velum]